MNWITSVLLYGYLWSEDLLLRLLKISELIWNVDFGCSFELLTNHTLLGGKYPPKVDLRRMLGTFLRIFGSLSDLGYPSLCLQVREESLLICHHISIPLFLELGSQSPSKTEQIFSVYRKGCFYCCWWWNFFVSGLRRWQRRRFCLRQVFPPFSFSF